MKIVHRPLAGGGVALAGSLLSLLAAGCGGGGGGGGGSDANVGANPLVVIDMDINGRDGVSLNNPFTLEFSEWVDADTIRHDTIQVRLGPRHGIQASGDFKVEGNLVTFYPQLPTRADLSDAGFQPQSNYRVTVVGAPKVNRVAAYSGRPLLKSFTGSFATAPVTSADLFTTATYKDDPPPTVTFTNPPDVLPVAPWTAPGGATNVATDAGIVVNFNRVPLRPETITTSNITLTMVERLGVSQNRPVQGTPVVQQSFDGVRLLFVPTFPLADQARYALRIENRVTDLSGQFDVSDNAARANLRSQAESGGDAALTAFALANPEEVDPRTFLIFTTRDEPTKDLSVFLRFDGTDLDEDGGDGIDTAFTTASVNDVIPGSVAANFTAAGGNGTLGDFSPASNTTLSTNSPSAVNGAFNFQRVNIGANVTVTLSGTLPATILALKDVNIAGSVISNGANGVDGEADFQDSTLDIKIGGNGGAGAGKGGNAYVGTSYANTRGDDGQNGPNGGGNGGQGGSSSASTTFNFGGGGGGGGRQYPGKNGSNGNYPSTASWNGTGGTGGAAGGIQPTSALTDDGKNFHLSGTGGGGGGAGGNTYYYPTSTNWRNSAGSGGGAGGSILVKGALSITVSGTISARGGNGGQGGNASSYGGGAGGAGSGGSIALFANSVLNVGGATLDTSGGIGGASTGNNWNGRGGDGGGGFVQLEDADGSVAGTSAATMLPDHYTGTFDPTGTDSDAPSFYVSTWFNVGVNDPIVQAFVPQDFQEQVFPGTSIKYEMQMADEDSSDFGHADTGSVNAVTGASSDLNRASNWVTIKDPVVGIVDNTALLNGKGYQFYRVRITFTLKNGQKRTDPVPYVEQMRIRVKY